VIRVLPEYGRTRDQLAEELAARGIGTSVHFIPVHSFGYFRRLLGDQGSRLPVAERMADQLLSLPLYPQLADSDVDYVAAQIRDLCRTGGE
jgi:perosamine synthetase